MDQGMLYELVLSGLRLLFIVVAPPVVAVLIGGLLAGVLQGATTVRDVSIGYFGRLLALLITLYLMYPLVSFELVQFTERCFQ